jgi:hypothetical protein
MRIIAKRDYGKYLVHIDGRDITNRCYEADDVQGWAKVYVPDEAGYPQLAPDKSALLTETLCGDVVITLREVPAA